MGDQTAQPPVPSPLHSPARTDRSPWNWLLLVPIVLPLLTFVYNRETPVLFGFPFFFWFQMLFAPLAVVASVTVFYLTRRSLARRPLSPRYGRGAGREG
jgi:Protein of unknown function (DUF3311)